MADVVTFPVRVKLADLEKVSRSQPFQRLRQQLRLEEDELIDALMGNHPPSQEGR